MIIQHSHTVCLTSVDRPHEAPGLIGSSRMLVHDCTFLMVDVDQTSSIDVCRLFGCSRSSTKMVERLMILFLKFGGLTTLVAHVLTSRTLSQNPREHEKKVRPLLSPFLFFSFLFSFQKPLSRHPFFSDHLFACPLLSPF